jgi:uncharacterized protein YbjT (DUF2867 family)
MHGMHGLHARRAIAVFERREHRAGRHEKEVLMFVVAGVSGHVGSVAAQALLDEGQKVKVVVRDAAKGAAWSRKGAEVAVGSLEDRAFLATALRGASGFFTLLPPNYQAADAFYEVQRSTADAITSAVVGSSVPHVVLLSSVGADLAEGNGPIKNLHYLENALRAGGVKLTAIRAAYFLENLASNLEPARKMGIFPAFTPSADYPMPTIATKDIGAFAAGALLAPPTKSEAVDLLGPSYSMRQMAEKLGAALGKTLQVVEIPQAGWAPTLVQAGLPRALADAYAEMYGGFASGAIRPRGDRAAQGHTTIDEVLKVLVTG